MTSQQQNRLDTINVIDRLRNSLANVLQVVREIDPLYWQEAEQLSGVYGSVQVAMDALDDRGQLSCPLCNRLFLTDAILQVHFDVVHLPLL